MLRFSPVWDQKGLTFWHPSFTFKLPAYRFGCVYQKVQNIRTDILPILYLFVLYLSENKQWILPHIK